MNRNKSNVTQYILNLVVSGLLIAIVFVATYAVQIPLPGIATGGLIHLGNVALFIIAVLFGKKFGAVSGAFGMALFDILSAWVIWAPATFIIRGIMGFAVGSIANGGKKEKIQPVRLAISMILPGLFMIFGYFVYNLILYKDLPVALASIPGDIIQLVAGIIIAYPIIIGLQSSGSAKYLQRYI